jgi:two-component system chemotaxis response regulator CheY
LHRRIHLLVRLLHQVSMIVDDTPAVERALTMSSPSGDRLYMSKRILTVDDSASMRQMVMFTLRGAGYEVVQACDGVEALELARESAADLVLTDVHMPRMDGITLVRELRTLPAYKFVPMLILTTESSQAKKMDGKRAGATGWIVKPFNPPQLLATVARVI